MNALTLSVIVPVYNVEQYLQTCIDSVLRQTFTDYEIILINDGSSDRSPEICEFMASADSRIQVVHQPNQGLSAARNKGLELATGRYIAFLDSDDEFGQPTLLMDAITVLKNDPRLEFVQFPTMWYYSERNHTILGKYTAAFNNNQSVIDAFCNNIITSTAWDKIYRRDIFENLRFPIGRFYEDTWFMSDYIPTCKKAQCIDSGFYKYNQRQGSITQSVPTLKKNIDCIDSMTKVLNGVLCRSNDSRPFLRAYVSIAEHLTDSILQYGINPHETLILNYETIKVSRGSILRSFRHLSTARLLKIIILKLFGFRALLKFTALMRKSAVSS